MNMEIATSNTEEEVVITRRHRDTTMRIRVRHQDGKKTFKTYCHHRSIFIKVNLISIQSGKAELVLRFVSLTIKPLNEAGKQRYRQAGRQTDVQPPKEMYWRYCIVLMGDEGDYSV